ncbi:MAG: hypothetical protein P8J22_09655, partial [Pseudomonadales bacterium]|nr:hypothetical protein [Pseudomonadales bacterium]
RKSHARRHLLIDFKGISGHSAASNFRDPAGKRPELFLLLIEGLAQKLRKKRAFRQIFINIHP